MHQSTLKKYQTRATNFYRAHCGTEPPQFCANLRGFARSSPYVSPEQLQHPQERVGTRPDSSRQPRRGESDPKLGQPGDSTWLDTTEKAEAQKSLHRFR